MTTETENIEFKAKFTEDLYKEIIAFANTDGGGNIRPECQEWIDMAARWLQGI